MPPSPESRAPSSSRRVTDVLARLKANNFEVCRCGPTVALHIATERGRVVVELPEKMFVQAARSDKDSNGNPYRSLSEIAIERLPVSPESAKAVSARSQNVTGGGQL